MKKIENTENLIQYLNKNLETFFNGTYKNGILEINGNKFILIFE